MKASVLFLAICIVAAAATNHSIKISRAARFYFGNDADICDGVLQAEGYETAGIAGEEVFLEVATYGAGIEFKLLCQGSLSAGRAIEEYTDGTLSVLATDGLSSDGPQTGKVVSMWYDASVIGESRYFADPDNLAQNLTVTFIADYFGFIDCTSCLAAGGGWCQVDGMKISACLEPVASECVDVGGTFYNSTCPAANNYCNELVNGQGGKAGCSACLAASADSACEWCEPTNNLGDPVPELGNCFAVGAEDLFCNGNHSSHHSDSGSCPEVECSVDDDCHPSQHCLRDQCVCKEFLMEITNDGDLNPYSMPCGAMWDNENERPNCAVEDLEVDCSLENPAYGCVVDEHGMGRCMCEPGTAEVGGACIQTEFKGRIYASRPCGEFLIHDANYEGQTVTLLVNPSGGGMLVDFQCPGSTFAQYTDGTLTTEVSSYGPSHGGSFIDSVWFEAHALGTYYFADSNDKTANITIEVKPDLFTFSTAGCEACHDSGGFWCEIPDFAAACLGGDLALATGECSGVGGTLYEDGSCPATSDFCNLVANDNGNPTGCNGCLAVSGCSWCSARDGDEVIPGTGQCFPTGDMGTELFCRAEEETNSTFNVVVVTDSGECETPFCTGDDDCTGGMHCSAGQCVCPRFDQPITHPDGFMCGPHWDKDSEDYNCLVRAEQGYLPCYRMNESCVALSGFPVGNCFCDSGFERDESSGDCVIVAACADVTCADGAVCGSGGICSCIGGQVSSDPSTVPCTYPVIAPPPPPPPASTTTTTTTGGGTTDNSSPSTTGDASAASVVAPSALMLLVVGLLMQGH